MEQLQKKALFNPRRQVSLTPASKMFYNRGVSSAYRARGTVQTSRPMSDTHYWNANLTQAYGRPHLAGWLDDAVGNLVPGMQVNVDTGKLIQAAQGLLSPKTAEKYATALNKYGLSAQYRGVEITPNRFATAWKYAGVAGVLKEVPVWAWVLGAGGLTLGLYWVMKK